MELTWLPTLVFPMPKAMYAQFWMPEYGYYTQSISEDPRYMVKCWVEIKQGHGLNGLNDLKLGP